MKQIQQSGAYGMRIKHENNSKDTTVLFFHKKGLDPEVLAARRQGGNCLTCLAWTLMAVK